MAAGLAVLVPPLAVLEKRSGARNESGCERTPAHNTAATQRRSTDRPRARSSGVRHIGAHSRRLLGVGGRAAAGMPVRIRLARAAGYVRRPIYRIRVQVRIHPCATAASASSCLCSASLEPYKRALTRVSADSRVCVRLATCVQDSKAPRDGKFIEEIGTYYPVAETKRDVSLLRCRRLVRCFGAAPRPAAAPRRYLLTAGFFFADTHTPLATDARARSNRRS
eukprot:COSAG06_NODE_1011_length_11045_cov_6.246723_9_plen_223_part_00